MKAIDVLDRLCLHCDGARDWVGDRDPRTAWLECQRGDWMLRVAYELLPERNREEWLVEALCRIAREIVHHVPGPRDREVLTEVIAQAHDYTRGERSWTDLFEGTKVAIYIEGKLSTDVHVSQDGFNPSEKAADAAAAVVDMLAFALAVGNPSADRTVCVSDLLEGASLSAATAPLWWTPEIPCYEDAEEIALARQADIVRSVVPWDAIELGLVRMEASR